MSTSYLLLECLGGSVLYMFYTLMCAWNAPLQWVWQTYCSGTGAERNPGYTGFFTLFFGFFSPFCALAASCTVTLPRAQKCLVCVSASRSGWGCFSNTFHVHSSTFHMSCKKLSWNPLARCLFNTVCLNRNFTGSCLLPLYKILPCCS